MIRQIILCVLLPLVVTGCARKELNEVSSKSYEVSFRSDALVISSPTNPSLTPGNEFRNQTKGLLPEDQTIRVVVFQNNDLVAQRAYKVLDDGSLEVCSVDDEGSVIGSDKPLVLRSGNYDFYAYGPARSLGADHATVNDILHGTDFIGSAPLSGISVSGKTVIPLSFEHKVSRIEIGVKPTEGIQIHSLTAHRAALNYMASSPGSYTLGGSIAPSVGDQTSVCLIESFTQADATSGSGSTIVLPKEAASFEVSMEVTVDGIPYTLTGNVPPMAFEAGFHYKFTARCKEGEADLTLTIVAPWGSIEYEDEGLGTGGFGTVEMTVVEGWNNVEWTEEIGK